METKNRFWKITYVIDKPGESISEFFDIEIVTAPNALQAYEKLLVKLQSVPNPENILSFRVEPASIRSESKTT